MNFDMNDAWSRAIELIKENFQLLIIISAVFLLLPSIAVYLLMPDLIAMTDANADPELVAEQLLSNLPPILIGGGISMLVQFAGYGAMVALMGPSRPTVGQAIGVGFQITLSTLAVFVLFLLAYILGATIVIIPFAILAAAVGAPALSAIAALLILPMVIYIAARMSMSLPALVLEGTRNPFTAVLRSFKLTHKKQWSILVFWTVLAVAYIVIALLFTGGMGAIAALAGGGTGTALILGIANGVMGMAIGMIMCGLAVAIFQQLAGLDGAAASSIFE